jgi:arylsulfatase A-like enzyme
VIEGRSLHPFLRGEVPAEWREAAFSEYDYVIKEAGRVLGQGLRDCKLYMVRTHHWFAMFAPSFRPMLFDLQSDPNELNDLGANPPAGVIGDLKAHLLTWALKRKSATTVSESQIEELLACEGGADGIYYGVWNKEGSLL